VNFAIPPGPRMEHASCITGKLQAERSLDDSNFQPRSPNLNLMLTEPFRHIRHRDH